MIGTARLLLRRPTEADTPVFCQLRQDEIVRRYLGGPVSWGVAEAKASANLQQWRSLGFGEWAVCDRASGQVFGLCGLFPSEDGTELSYMFAPAFWGRGLATEAARAALWHGFSTLGLQRIIAITQEANHGSCRLLERVGMRHTRTLWQWDAVQRFYEMMTPVHAASEGYSSRR